MYNLNVAHTDSVLHTLEKLNQFVDRINSKDYTLWKSNNEIDRLGWLNSPHKMFDQLSYFDVVHNRINVHQYDYVVLIGMGGSNNGAKTIYKMALHKQEYPQLLIVDSTVPENIHDISNQIYDKETLFIVSSKSGETIETICLYKYFRQIIDDKIGRNEAGRHFIAITDKNSRLESLALEENFSSIFINDTNIGGRYSVLSYFGLVPASIVGINIEKLLKNAISMSKQCQISSLRRNDGVLLGSVLGTMVQLKRNICFIWCTKSTYSFAKWIQQLLSESLGKNETGIIPIIHIMHENNYNFASRNDSFHIILKHKHEFADEIIHDIQKMEEPALYVEMYDSDSIGAEFYKWEYATAVAGHIIDVNPFDEPDVLFAKIQTSNILNFYKNNKELPIIEFDDINSIAKQLLSKNTNDYFAINAYLPMNSNVMKYLNLLKQHVEFKYAIPTEIEFGPRYLHSTGQLHKGGSNNVFILQLMQKHHKHIQIPDYEYGFDILVNAQCIGDALSLKQLNKRSMVYDLSSNAIRGIEELIEQL